METSITINNKNLHKEHYKLFCNNINSSIKKELEV
jgi:hypothetical protein